MTIKFTLNVAIEGNTLDEVDKGLVEAAGQRLAARIQAKANAGIVPSGVVVTKDAEIPGGSVILKPMKELTPQAETAIKAVVQTEKGAAEKDVAEPQRGGETPHPLLQPKRKPGRPKGTFNDTKQEKEKQASEPEKIETKKEKAKDEAPKKENVKVVEKKDAPSLEEVIQALNSVFKKFGMDYAREVLGRFGAQKASGLAEDKRAEFIEHCQALVAKEA